MLSIGLQFVCPYCKSIDSGKQRIAVGLCWDSWISTTGNDKLENAILEISGLENCRQLSQEADTAMTTTSTMTRSRHGVYLLVRCCVGSSRASCCNATTMMLWSLSAPIEGFALGREATRSRFCEDCARRVANMGAPCPLFRAVIHIVMRVFL